MQVCSTLERIGQRVVIDIGVVGDEAATEVEESCSFCGDGGCGVHGLLH